MANSRKIKVLIVDDSLVFREALRKGIESDPALEVVGTASDPFDARDKIIELEPDVLTLDVEMPKMSGIEFLKRLMPQYPIPVVVVSAVSESVFEALDSGAVDFVTKPDYRNQNSIGMFVNELALKVKIASTAKVGKNRSVNVQPGGTRTFQRNSIEEMVIAIGASTGGTEAIYGLIKSLPPKMPGIVVVQHMPPVFTRMYAERLNNNCCLEVKEASDGDAVLPGRVLIAPGGDRHMKIVRSGSGYKVALFKAEKVNGHCPSVDVMFDSVANMVGKKSIGVILTGMGNDGAKGLLEMKKRGAFTIGQDEKTSVVYGMPMVAYNIGAVHKQLALGKIPEAIFNHLASVR